MCGACTCAITFTFFDVKYEVRFAPGISDAFAFTCAWVEAMMLRAGENARTLTATCGFIEVMRGRASGTIGWAYTLARVVIKDLRPRTIVNHPWTAAVAGTLMEDVWRSTPLNVWALTSTQFWIEDLRRVAVFGYIN